MTEINIPPHSGGYFLFGHSPNTTGCAQVRCLLACQPCKDYLLPVNGLSFFKPPSEREVPSAREAEGACVHKKNSSRHIAYCSTLGSHSPSVAIATAPSRREPSHKSILHFLFICFSSSLIGKAFFQPRDYRVVFVLQKDRRARLSAAFFALFSKNITF